jgi:hypothetical protein
MMGRPQAVTEFVDQDRDGGDLMPLPGGCRLVLVPSLPGSRFRPARTTGLAGRGRRVTAQFQLPLGRK